MFQLNRDNIRNKFNDPNDYNETTEQIAPRVTAGMIADKLGMATGTANRFFTHDSWIIL